MIRRLVLKTIRAPQLARVPVRTEKKMRHVEHVRPEVGEDTQTVVAPCRVANVSSCSIAVEEFREINLAELSGIENLLEPGDVRLEPMVISGVACSLSGLREFE